MTSPKGDATGYQRVRVDPSSGLSSRDPQLGAGHPRAVCCIHVEKIGMDPGRPYGPGYPGRAPDKDLVLAPAMAVVDGVLDGERQAHIRTSGVPPDRSRQSLGL